MSPQQVQILKKVSKGKINLTFYFYQHIYTFNRDLTISATLKFNNLIITEGAQDWFIYKITVDTYKWIFLIVVTHEIHLPMTRFSFYVVTLQHTYIKWRRSDSSSLPCLFLLFESCNSSCRCHHSAQIANARLSHKELLVLKAAWEGLYSFIW